MIRFSLIRNYISILTVVASVFLVIGCQGRTSPNSPIHLNPNMDQQPRYDPQSASSFFVDGSAMRQPVEGTVARGNLREDRSYYEGFAGEDTTRLSKSPVDVTHDGLKRGQERYGIYCAVCHGDVGDGKGIVIDKGFVPPPSFHSDKIRNYLDGQLFDFISNGVRNMPSYKAQIPVKDRWLIVNYLRVLQRSQNASLEDVPESEKAKLTMKSGGAK